MSTDCISSTTSDQQQQPIQLEEEDLKMSTIDAQPQQPPELLLEEELQHSKADAQETLTALLQFATGVRAITQHMQSTTTSSSSNGNTDDEGKEGEESKGDDDDDEDQTSVSTTAVVSPESLVADTCLQGTVFGTDLMRLLGAAHHVRDYARLVTEESSVSAYDVHKAQEVTRAALTRAKRAESVARKLAQSSSNLQHQVSQMTAEKKVLAREVVRLRQQVATSRQTDMERLLQQHVVGALLVHEGQLKAAVQQQQTQTKKLRRRRVAEEEEKKEELDEEDMEMIQVEDCQSEGRRTPTALLDETSEKAPTTTTTEPAAKADPAIVKEETHAGGKTVKKSSSEDKESKATVDDKVTDTMVGKADPAKAAPKVKASTKGVLGDANKTATKTTAKTIAANQAPTKKVATKDSNIKKVKTANNKENATNTSSITTKAKGSGIGSTSIAAASYMPIQLYQGFGERHSPVPPPSSKQQQQKQQQSKATSTSSTNASVSATVEKPSSSRSISSSSQQPPEHVGSKVFNFLFHPEKIGQQEREARHQQHEQSSSDGIMQPKAKAQPVKRKTKKLSPLLKLDDLLFGEENSNETTKKDGNNSVDGTIATLVTTTPASSCAASPIRTMTGMASNKPTNTSMGNNVTKSQGRIIPNCVSFSDIVSVESNLNSPSLQPSPKPEMTTRTIVDVDEIIAAAHKALQESEGMAGKGDGDGNGDDVELYKNMKIFQSLSLPNEDDIGDYHEYQDQQQLLLQRKPESCREPMTQ